MFKSSWGQHVLVIMAPLNTHPNTLNSQVERKKTKETNKKNMYHRTHKMAQICKVVASSHTNQYLNYTPLYP